MQMESLKILTLLVAALLLADEKANGQADSRPVKSATSSAALQSESEAKFQHHSRRSYKAYIGATSPNKVVYAELASFAPNSIPAPAPALAPAAPYTATYPISYKPVYPAQYVNKQYYYPSATPTYSYLPQNPAQTYANSPSYGYQAPNYGYYYQTPSLHPSNSYLGPGGQYAAPYKASNIPYDYYPTNGPANYGPQYTYPVTYGY